MMTERVLWSRLSRGLTMCRLSLVGCRYYVYRLVSQSVSHAYPKAMQFCGLSTVGHKIQVTQPTEILYD